MGELRRYRRAIRPNTKICLRNRVFLDEIEQNFDQAKNQEKNVEQNSKNQETNCHFRARLEAWYHKSLENCQ